MGKIKDRVRVGAKEESGWEAGGFGWDSGRGRTCDRMGLATGDVSHVLELGDESRHLEGVGNAGSREVAQRERKTATQPIQRVFSRRLSN